MLRAVSSLSVPAKTSNLGTLADRKAGLKFSNHPFQKGQVSSSRVRHVNPASGAGATQSWEGRLTLADSSFRVKPLWAAQANASSTHPKYWGRFRTTACICGKDSIAVPSTTSTTTSATRVGRSSDAATCTANAPPILCPINTTGGDGEEEEGVESSCVWEGLEVVVEGNKCSTTPTTSEISVAMEKSFWSGVQVPPCPLRSIATT
mmetsp:Transcript_11878/g.16099  ORF Transcript_11878/g.16099 Transcript_11878/m.16099 type:complete len:206 (-) Transcript_11878:212-829(-)|eukprot:CAMPEP_0196584544 /NCGR_PEP_ID=MMETSP1081-20130531/47517_1 /TAXON_ID=36882 /ORGANISM="Pyramimonas amylifera, Strain CCMP720" /LENGTH=205 /DNA_ID=CAMNT_0041905781 /DNA_START=200 /DNA_END=817 /DNA_ORIENTATION=+